MKWTTRIWMRGIEEIIKHPMAAVAITGGLAWHVTRAFTFDLVLNVWLAETARYTWRLSSGTAATIGRHAGKTPVGLAAKQVASQTGRSAVALAVRYPFTTGAVLAIAGTAAQANVMAKHGGGVRGTGTFGVAPSRHLEGGKPWWM